MQKKRFVGLFVGMVATALAPAAHAGVLLFDTMTNTTETGSLAGSAADTTSVGTGTWQTTYTDNGGEIVPATQTDSTGAGYPAAATTGILPVDAVRSASGTNFGGYTSHTDDSAFISLTTAPTGLIVSSATFTFSNIASSNNPTAWGFLGLTTSLTSPDVIANVGSIGPWALVRPTSNGTDIVEVYANGGTGHLVATSNVDPGLATHTVQLQFDPSTGTLDALVDGVSVLGTPYSYTGHSLAIPVVDGDIIGDRTSTGVATASNPSSAIFTNVSVTQAVPEPTSLAFLGLTGLLLRRRRLSK